MKAYGGVNVQIQVFLTSAQAGGEWSASRPCLQGKSPRYTLYKRLGGPQSPSGRHEEITILDPSGTRIRTPWSPDQ
jgi:hypothetical protein